MGERGGAWRWAWPRSRAGILNERGDTAGAAPGARIRDQHRDRPRSRYRHHPWVGRDWLRDRYRHRHQHPPGEGRDWLGDWYSTGWGTRTGTGIPGGGQGAAEGLIQHRHPRGRAGTDIGIPRGMDRDLPQQTGILLERTPGRHRHGAAERQGQVPTPAPITRTAAEKGREFLGSHGCGKSPSRSPAQGRRARDGQVGAANPVKGAP